MSLVLFAIEPNGSSRAVMACLNTPCPQAEEFVAVLLPAIAAATRAYPT